MGWERRKGDPIRGRPRCRHEARWSGDRHRVEATIQPDIDPRFHLGDVALVDEPGDMRLVRWSTTGAIRQREAELEIFLRGELLSLQVSESTTSWKVVDSSESRLHREVASIWGGPRKPYLKIWRQGFVTWNRR